MRAWVAGLLVVAAGCGSRGAETDAGAGVPSHEALVAAANGYSCAMREGTAWCWGRHPRFAGDRAPVRFPELAAVVELAAGESVFCGRRADGRVLCASRPFFPTDSPSVAEIAEVPRIADARAIAAGDRHVCALVATGDVYCWGKNDRGQLGDVALGDRGAPPASPVVQRATWISARGDTTCAVAEGRVICWGRRLGAADGAAPARPTPVPRLQNVSAVAVGARHACALDALGRVGCWGTDAAGALVAPRPDAVYVEIAAGRDVTCGRRRGTGGAVECWGENAVRRPVSGARSLALGPDHGCVARARDVACWGDNDEGQVLGSLSRERPPSRVADLDDAIDVQTHSGGRCALRRNGEVVCWGRLDPVPWSDAVEPSEPPRWRVAFTPQKRNGVRGATALAMGEDHGCAHVAEGRLACWGSNEHGELGIPGATILRDAREVPSIAGARAVCATDGETAIIDATGAVQCVGRCGEGEWTTREWHAVSGITGAVEIGCGGRFSCARTDNGEVWCWGEDLRVDRLDDLGRLARPMPPRAPRPWLAARDVSRLWVGERRACARGKDGALSCWGYFVDASVGAVCAGTSCVVTREPRPIPAAEGVDELDADGFCLFRRGRPLECRGERAARELAALGAVSVIRWTDGCALLDDGSVRCWGPNAEGEVGDGTLEHIADAVPVPALGGHP